MTSHGSTPTSGIEIGFGGNRILLIAQMVSAIRQGFHERHAQVGGVALAPLRQDSRHAIKHQTPEAVIVLCQIVDVRRWLDFRWATTCWQAIEIGCALHFEREVHSRKAGVEILWRPLVLWSSHQTQRVY